MRRIRPEKMLVFGIIAPLVFGGLALALLGAATESRRVLNIGTYAAAVGVCISCLPLIGACLYFSWLRLSRMVRPKKP
ncbi:MAG TPA: hypothetical protein VGM76_13910 [Lacipirellulaceae bacterium]|jgi:hypothetical protein